MLGMTGTVITVAPTGGEGSKPLDQLLSTAKECSALGAAIIRVHTAGAVAELRASTDLIVQLASGPLESGPEMAACPLGAADLVDRHTRMQECAIVPAYEIADLGQLVGLQRLLDRYGRPAGGHVHVELVLGTPGGLPGTAAALVACEQAIRDLPPGTTFSATGVGSSSLPVILTSLATGGHLRVGTEDTISYAKGRPVESDMQLVARAVGFAQLAQRPPVTADEARELLGLSGRRSATR
jgi:3-keto-5-aminohexanoate cleavage enzyme